MRAAWWVFFWSAAATAQTSLPTLELERLDLNPSAQGSLVGSTGRILEDGELRISLLGHYQNEPLRVTVADGSAALVSDRWTAHLAGAFGIGNLELGFQAPYVVSQSGEAVGELAVPEASGLGTPEAYVRVQVLDEGEGAPLGLVAGVALGIPIGSEAALAREPLMTLAPHLAISRGFGPVVASVNAQYLYRPTSTKTRDPLSSEFGLGASLSTVGRLRGELSARAAFPRGGGASAYEVLGGVRYAFLDSVEVFALGGPGFGSAPGSPRYRALLGLAFGQVGEARPQAVDVCAPGQAQPPESCPDLDFDGDLVQNAADRCAEAGEDRDGFQDDDGCPDPDNDADGVADAMDQCPSEAGPAPGGCPVRATAPAPPPDDLDADGVRNDVDACPKEAGDAGLRGCAIKDSDGDAVVDHQDNCIEVEGDPNNAGCPRGERQWVTISRDRLILKRTVSFVVGKPQPTSRSRPILDQVARILREHPEIPYVLIEAPRIARAEAVRDYLVRKGVEPKRLEALEHSSREPLVFTIVDAPPAVDLLEPLVPGDG